MGYSDSSPFNHGFLYGPLDERGEMSGEAVAFVYPDMRTALAGRFRGNVMKRARATKVRERKGLLLLLLLLLLFLFALLFSKCCLMFLLFCWYFACLAYTGNDRPRKCLCCYCCRYCRYCCCCCLCGCFFVGVAAANAFRCTHAYGYHRFPPANSTSAGFEQQ